MACQCSCTYCFSVLVEFDIDINTLIGYDLPCVTFAERLKKARILAGLSQIELAEAASLSRATINDYEVSNLDNISRDTLLKLINVLDKDILCDDYCRFILNQTNNMKTFLNTYNSQKLYEILGVHITTIERWINGNFQVSRKQYTKLSDFYNNTKSLS